MQLSALRNTIAEVQELRSTYISERAAFVPGHVMIGLLKGLGATDADLAAIQHVSQGLKEDPTLPFRRSKNGRFCFDFDLEQIYRLEFQPFVLSVDDDFVRHDSGQVRQFAEIENDLQLNTVLRALLKFQSLMFRDVAARPRLRLDYGSNKWICTLFNLRTVTSPELTGEPALEGVHADGVDHTMTTFLGSENMTDDSATTFIHQMGEQNGKRWHEADPALLIGSWQHNHFLDTLLIIDNEHKHSLSPLHAADPQRTATRDMLIFFTRKPVVEGHVSYEYDSLKRHKVLPMSTDLPSPQ